MFLLERDGEKIVELPSNARTRDRCMSTGWDAAFPIEEGEETPFTVTLTFKHRTLKETLARSVTLNMRERA
jgi:hypothetical protein